MTVPSPRLAEENKSMSAVPKPFLELGSDASGELIRGQNGISIVENTDGVRIFST
jgi:hypothetical protein